MVWMEIIGSLDNAVRFGANFKNTVLHLIFTPGTLYSIKVLDRKQELDNMDMEEERSELSPGSSSNAVESHMQMKLAERAIHIGEEIEADFIEYIETNPDDVDTMKLSRITRAEFSRGSMFALPYVRFVMANTELKYELIRESYGKAGKLKDLAYQTYLGTLRDVFGDKVRVRP